MKPVNASQVNQKDESNTLENSMVQALQPKPLTEGTEDVGIS